MLIFSEGRLLLDEELLEGVFLSFLGELLLLDDDFFFFFFDFLMRISAGSRDELRGLLLALLVFTTFSLLLLLLALLLALSLIDVQLFRRLLLCRPVLPLPFSVATTSSALIFACDWFQMGFSFFAKARKKKPLNP